MPVAGVHGTIGGVSGRNDPGFPQQRIVVVGYLRDAAACRRIAQDAVVVGRRLVYRPQQALRQVDMVVLRLGDDVVTANDASLYSTNRLDLDGT